MPRSILCALVAGLALAASACTSESPSGPRPDPVGPPSSPPPPPDPAPVVLECEEKNYPCSFSEVPLEVLERSDALGDEARAMLRGGASTQETAAWLQQQSEMAEVEWDDLAIRFRLEEGRGTWVVREGGFAESDASGGPSAVRRGPLRHVVASGTEEKRALVLSPFLWYFGSFDDAAFVAPVLKGTRGYNHAAGVKEEGNTSKEDNSVGVHSFYGWQAYQVIHVSSHGRRLCGDAGCRAAVAVGRLETHLSGGEESRAQQIQALKDLGLEVVLREGDQHEEPDDYLYATADFFRKAYGAGLSEALIFFSACQTFGPEATDLVEAVQGRNTVVLGWDEIVGSGDARNASVALYEYLGEWGYPAKVAYDELGALRTGIPSAKTPDKVPHLRLLERRGGGDIRIREVALLLQPVTGNVLEPADLVEVEGALDDGVRDTVPFLVRVDGVKPAFAGQTSVRVQVDGQWSAPVSVSTGERNDLDQWFVDGLAGLPRDLQDDEEVTFRTEVALHSGGESRDETTAIVTGPLSMGRTWELESVFTSGPPASTWSANARLTLSFVGENDIDDPSRPFRVTGGSVMGRIDYEEGGCRITSQSFSYNVPGAGVDIFGLVDFDVSERPVEYAGALGTMGPPITVTFSCPGIVTHLSTRVMLTWLTALPGEGRTVSNDRRTFSGTSREDAPGLVIESTWTARRVE